MMEHFWKQYNDLPEGVGYEHFSMPHILTLAVVAALVFVIAVCFQRLDAPQQRRILVAIPWAMVALECVKDGFLLSVGQFSVGYLPLHLCGLGALVFLLEAHARTRRWQTVFSEIAVTLILPGALAALLFPDWTELYPVLNFMNLYGFTWHGLLLLYPILLIEAGRVHLSVRHIHYDLLFLLCTAVPVYCFDKAFRCNYMFLNWPPKGTPLAWIAGITGEEWYLAGYAVFAILVIGVIYLGVYVFIDRREAKAPRKG